jgi:IclR family transcriptional regulator, pca regulon regulatory protein
MKKSPRSTDRSFIASLSHGLSILETVADAKGDISLGELAKRAGFKKTSAWRLAHTLVELGYLHQDGETRNFRPAARVLTLGYAYFDSLDLKQLSVPFMREICTKYDETVNLAVRNGDELIYLERFDSSQIVRVNLHVGSRLPLFCTSLGRALISEMDDAWLEKYVERISDDPKAQKWVQPQGKKLVTSLREVRERGYALNDEELVKGLRAIASPIRDSSSKIVAAVCISVPSIRFTMAELEKVFSPELIEAAHKISLALGYRPKSSNRFSRVSPQTNEAPAVRKVV